MAYVNPIGRGLKSGRVDMGVDYTGHGSLYAMGSGVITSIRNSGWPGGTFIGLHLDSGHYMYYAENIIPHVSRGQRVQAGQLVGTAVGTYPYTEIGWAAPPGTGGTMAAQAGQSAKGQAAGDPGKYPTGYGVSMSNLIKSLGGPPGIISGPIQGGTPASFTAANTSPQSAMAGCVPLVYQMWVMWNASRACYYRINRQSSKRHHSLAADIKIRRQASRDR